MSKHRKLPTRTARKTSKPKSAPVNPRERELATIAAVLATLPVVDREKENSQTHPYNEIASAEAMQKLVATLVRQRYPDNLWNAAHGPMCKTDRNGRGYWSWTDAYRDAAFQCGVEYAMRSLPDWWPLLRLISPDTLEDLGAFVRRIAENSLDTVPTAEQRVFSVLARHARTETNDAAHG